MTLFTTTLPTPAGLFSIAIDENGALAATAFGDLTVLRRRLEVCHLIDDNPPRECHLLDDNPPRRTRAARGQIAAYFTGERRKFDLPLAPRGTEFQQRVWAALQQIPFGETRSYGELAATLGNPAASRAVGRANATNPICLIVPCHRVIGRDGSLTGFAFGEEIKRLLLEHERTLAARRPRAA